RGGAAGPPRPLPDHRPVRGLSGRGLRSRSAALAGPAGAAQRAAPRDPAHPGGGRRPLGAERHLAGRPGPGRRGRPGRAGPGRGRPGRRQGAPGGRPGPAGAGPGRGWARRRRARARGRQVGPEALAWLARAEAEWARAEGRPDPDRWSAAADAFGYGYLYEEARCRWRLAETLLTEGDRDRAAEQALAAHELAGRLGAAPLLATLEALGRRGRLDLGAQTRPGPDAPGLTPRELEVLRLGGRGRGHARDTAGPTV